jgi:hypothetical protein
MIPTEIRSLTDDGKSKILVISTEPVLGESSKIGHVHSHGAEESDDDIQSSESGVGGVHVGRRNHHFSSDQFPSALRHNDGPKEESKERRRNLDDVSR